MPRMPNASRAIVVIALSCLGAASAAVAQTQPRKPENLQHFPQDISERALIQRMREFSFALGVRCQYCHIGGDGISFEGVVFKSDDKPAKRKARAMLRMTDEINGKLLAAIPDRATPVVKVDCVTCHRGLPLPKTLATVLTERIDKDGIDAGVAEYRRLRTNTMESGRFDFGEWSMNELGRALAEAGKRDAAIAMLTLNAEHFPKSAAIDLQLVDLYLAAGDKERAIERLQAALTKDPNNEAAKRRLAELIKR